MKILIILGGETTVKYHYNIHGCNDLAVDIALAEWKNLIAINEPMHVDKHGFEYLVEQIKSKNNDKIILVTHRSNDILQHTLDHLKKLDIVYDELHLTAGGSKGNQIISILETYKYHDIKGVIFVDDKESNITDVIEKLSLLKINLDCYHMQ